MVKYVKEKDVKVKYVKEKYVQKVHFLTKISSQNCLFLLIFVVM